MIIPNPTRVCSVFYEIQLSTRDLPPTILQYHKDAVGAFVVSDLSRLETLDTVIAWKEELDSKVQLADGSKIPCFLLGNKVQLFQSKQFIYFTNMALANRIKKNLRRMLKNKANLCFD